MSDEKDKKQPKHEGVRIGFVRFKLGDDLMTRAGTQISSAPCVPEPTEHNHSYTCSYHGVGPSSGMYELRHFINGALSGSYWIPRERVAYHEVLA